MGVQRPNWWCYPERCANGHEWGPGLITVSWMPCDCPPAAAAREHGPGHMVVYCHGAGVPVGVVPAAARTGDLRTMPGPFGTDGRARLVMQWNRRGQRQDGEVIDAPGLGNAR